MEIQKLISVYNAKHYHYNDRDNIVNIFGIRSENSQSDKFDDVLGYAVKYSGVHTIKTFPATTDPGKSWLLSPMRKDGTAIMVPGQYTNLYKIGRHKDYKALEQIGEALYVRDNNKDTTLDFSLYRDKTKLVALGFKGNIKSNIHRASAWKIVTAIGLYSAGCQVIQNPKDFDSLIGACEKQVLSGAPNKFTYTLFEHKDFQ